MLQKYISFQDFTFIFKHKIGPKYVKSQRVLWIVLQFYRTCRKVDIHGDKSIDLFLRLCPQLRIPRTGIQWSLQATLTLTAPHTPFVPPCIHNLLIFSTDCSCIALGTNIHSQVYVRVHTHTLAHTDAHALALAPFLGVSNVLVFLFLLFFLLLSLRRTLYSPLLPPHSKLSEYHLIIRI